MAKIRIDVPYIIKDGAEVSFTAPCNCTEVDGLKVYHPDGVKEFIFKDAHGNDLTGLGNLFMKGNCVNAILSVSQSAAYLQNAVTNSYLEGAIRARNLLDNSDFRNPVNQRGQKSYIGLYSGVNEKNYTIDRWLNYWGQLDIYVADGYVRFVNNTSAWVDIEQRFPYGTFDPSKKYTFVKKGVDGVVDVRQAKISSYPDAGLDVVQTSFAPGETRLLWVALYEGEYDHTNFPEYKPKGYTAELLECRRYYQELDHYAVGAGYSGSGGDVTAFVNTGIQMRTVPSLVYSGEWKARCGGSDFVCYNPGVSAFDKGNAATVRLVFQSMTITNFQTVTMYCTGKVALSADL